MRRLLDRARRYAAIAIVALITAGASISAAAQCPFNPDGYFVIAGNAPAGVESVAYVSLWEYGARPDTKHPTGVYATGGEAYTIHAKEIAVGPGGLGWLWNFTTADVSGTHYEFTGAFQDVGDFADPNIGTPGRIMPLGHLVMVRGGVHLAEADVRFTYTAKLPKKRKSPGS